MDKDKNKKAVPIVAEINLQGRNLSNTTLSINQKDNFTLKNLNGNNPLSLGEILLDTGNTNTISLYDNKDSSAITPDFSNLDYSLEPCNLGQNENPFGIDVAKNGNGFTIFGNNTSLCMTIPISQISKSSGKNISKDSLLGISFSYSGDKNPDVCALNLLTGGCIKNITDETIKVGYKDINSLGIRISLDALNNTPAPSTPFGVILEKSKKQQKASYQNIIFAIVKPFYSVELSPDILSKSLSEAYQTQNNTKTLFIPAINNDEFSKSIIDTTAQNNSCQESTKNVDKKIKSDASGQYIEYLSKEGSLCDYFSYPNLNQNTSFAITISAKNVKGLPLNICVSNPNSGRCDIYSALPATSNKTQTVFILPAMSKDKTGFTININNFAINKTESINDLYGIQVIPFPYAWLTNMSSGSYLTNKEVIELPYSYDNGWKAYRVKNVDLITETFPFLFGKELRTHIKVNSWENGWTIDKTSAADNQSSIVVIYLPQYLEYFGFVLLILVPLIFAIKRNLW